ncbi:hypothetical protein D3Y57_19270 [Sphingomonas paeninsulae]|uniref:DUF6950 domain-containing protein n=1 Tax=Sphingomonas paeninsulae TaxID=2319844 RepID=A0A494TRD5_SPHPE|nr:hypothetical protein [Sphingomonas paeninsulae]AYJ87675.1 hypothetical protein D3Y57_19270 [Sphingomonas paeninsulae]
MVMHVLERRKIATEATMARFVGKEFRWGSADCAKLAAFHLRQLGVKVGIAKAGKWTTALGAKAALKRMGVKSLSELADKHLAEIAPAAALPGDIMIMPGDNDFEGLAIVLGNGAVLGWHEEAEGCAVLRITYEQTRAWRAIV